MQDALGGFQHLIRRGDARRGSASGRRVPRGRRRGAKRDTARRDVDDLRLRRGGPSPMRRAASRVAQAPLLRGQIRHADMRSARGLAQRITARRDQRAQRSAERRAAGVLRDQAMPSDAARALGREGDDAGDLCVVAAALERGGDGRRRGTTPVPAIGHACTTATAASGGARRPIARDLSVARRSGRRARFTRSATTAKRGQLAGARADRGVEREQVGVDGDRRR